jgi:hypothetical protein
MVASKTPYTIEQAETDITDLRGMVYLLDEILTQYDSHIPNLPSASGFTMFSFGGQGCTLGYDGNPYNIGSQTVFLSPTPQNITSSSSTPITWGGGNPDVAANTTYRFRGFIEMVQGSGSSVQTLGFSGPSLTKARIVRNYQQQSAAVSGNWLTMNSMTTDNSPAFANGTTFYYIFDGYAQFSAQGTFSMIAEANSGTNTFELIDGWLDFWPSTVS